MAAEEQEEAGQEVVEEENRERSGRMDTAAAGQEQDTASAAYEEADLLVATKAASGIQRRSVDAGTRQPAAGVEPFGCYPSSYVESLRLTLQPPFFLYPSQRTRRRRRHLHQGLQPAPEAIWLVALLLEGKDGRWIRSWAWSDGVKGLGERRHPTPGLETKRCKASNVESSLPRA